MIPYNSEIFSSDTVADVMKLIKPKIGIRPIVDGRLKNVREDLESRVLDLANSVAKFLNANLKYTDAAPVECIVPNVCIGGVTEATKVDEVFRRQGVGLSISVTNCWCYGAETMDMNKEIPKAVWGFNGTERPGAVYLAAVLAAHNQKGIPAFGIYGSEVQNNSDSNIPNDVKDKLIKFAKAGLAVALMKSRSYLSIGGVSMGIAGSIVDSNFFEDYLGMRVEYVDMVEVLRRIRNNIYDPGEFNKALKWVKSNLNFSFEKKELDRKYKESLETSIKMTIIIKDFMQGNPQLADIGYFEEALGHNAIAGGFQGQRHWTDFLPTGDLPETILNSSFDWNGKRAPIIFATENDSLNAVSMLFGYLLTNSAQIFADVRTFWSSSSVKGVTGYNLTGFAKEGIMHLINSGSACMDGSGQQSIGGTPALKPFWLISDEEMKNCIDSSIFHPASKDYFPGGGFSVNFLTKGGMPVTMHRINLVKNLGPVLQLAEGYTVALPEKVHKELDKRTNPTWPTTWFAPILTGSGAFESVYSVMNSWGANHSAISYGHIGNDLITLASILRIPVCMHNVPEHKIFRPSYWNCYGDKNYYCTDLKACEKLGPLYGK